MGFISSRLSRSAATGLVVETRAGQPEQLTLAMDAQLGMLRLDERPALSHRGPRVFFEATPAPSAGARSARRASTPRRLPHPAAGSRGPGRPRATAPATASSSRGSGWVDGELAGQLVDRLALAQGLQSHLGLELSRVRLALPRHPSPSGQWVGGRKVSLSHLSSFWGTLPKPPSQGGCHAENRRLTSPRAGRGCQVITITVQLVQKYSTHQSIYMLQPGLLCTSRQ